MRVFIGSDHAGYVLKESLIEYLNELKCEVVDCGAFKYDKSDDYIDFIRPVALAVTQNPGSRGVVIGKSGQGEAIVSNRYSGIRSVVYYGGNLEIVRLSREHNDSNVLSLGAGFLTEHEAKEAMKLWLETPFTGGRHQRRIDKIDSLYEG